MKYLVAICFLAYLFAVCIGAHLRDEGRNDGEPDYDPGLIQARDGGRNDGEPEYDPDGI